MHPLPEGYAARGMALAPLRAYSRRMPKSDGPASSHPCLMPPEHLRRVQHPGDERVGPKPGVMRRALAKLTAAARAHS